MYNTDCQEVHTSEYSKEGVTLINKYWMKYTLNNIYQMEYKQVIESDQGSRFLYLSHNNYTGYN